MVYEKLRVAKYDNWSLKRVLLGKSVSNQSPHGSESETPSLTPSRNVESEDFFRTMKSVEGQCEEDKEMESGSRRSVDE